MTTTAAASIDNCCSTATLETKNNETATVWLATYNGLNYGYPWLNITNVGWAKEILQARPLKGES